MPAPAPPVPEPPAISADAYILLDAASGRVLAQRNGDQRRAPASTTKIMTGVLALELGDADDVVRVSLRAAGTPGSSAHVQAGDRYRLGDLVRGLLLKSGNDAAVAIAEHLAGSVPAFAGLMNDEARLLGLHGTHFTNPHGLTAQGHYTTARDLALLARYALTLPEFAEIVATQEASLPGLDARGRAISRHLRNTNRLLAYGWVTGVKTGTTNLAGDCLVASASRDGNELIAVVLHSDDRWVDALRLLQWGYDEFRFPEAARAGQVVARLPVEGGVRASVPVVAAADVHLAVPAGDASSLQTIVQLPARARAPLAAGDRVGTLVVRAGGREVASAPLVAAKDVPQGRWWDLLRAAP